MSFEHSSFPPGFDLNAFFFAMPATLKVGATNGKSHLKVLKAQGKSLQTYLASSFAVELTSAQALDAAARSYGFSDYNQARSVLLNAGSEQPTGEHVLSAEPEGNDNCLVDQRLAWAEGGFYVGYSEPMSASMLPTDAVVSALDVHVKPWPEGWYSGPSERYSKRAYAGRKSFNIGLTDSWCEHDKLVALLVERAQRLALAGLRSYLVLNRLNVNDRITALLLSTHCAFTPIINGYDTSVCGVPEGVPPELWREPKYPIFLSRLESTKAVQETAPAVAKSLGVSEARATQLLMTVPKGKYLRVPPLSAHTA